MKAIVLMPLLALMVQGCSVGMAMSGKPDPNIGVLSTRLSSFFFLTFYSIYGSKIFQRVTTLKQ
jgi:hypothetical protein